MKTDDPSLRWAVLGLLEKWGRLPLSDLVNLLQPLQRLHFRDELVRDLEIEGLVSRHPSGDDQVVEISPRGRASVVERRTVGGVPRVEADDDRAAD